MTQSNHTYNSALSKVQLSRQQNDNIYRGVSLCWEVKKKGQCCHEKPAEYYVYSLFRS